MKFLSSDIEKVKNQTQNADGLIIWAWKLSTFMNKVLTLKILKDMKNSLYDKSSLRNTLTYTLLHFDVNPYPHQATPDSTVLCLPVEHHQL